MANNAKAIVRGQYAHKELANANPVVNVIVQTEMQEVTYFKREDPVDKEKITGRGKRYFWNVYVKTQWFKGQSTVELFRIHTQRDEWKIILPKNKYQKAREKDQSMAFWLFIKTEAKRRWPNHHDIVVTEMRKFGNEKPVIFFGENNDE